MNLGEINADEFAALIGGKVVNEGTIISPGGSAALLAGDATLDIREASGGKSLLIYPVYWMVLLTILAQLMFHQLLNREGKQPSWVALLTLWFDRGIRFNWWWSSSYWGRLPWVKFRLFNSQNRFLAARYQ